MCKPLRLMKDSLTSKSHWAGHCPLVADTLSLKQSKLPPYPHYSIFPGNNQAFVVRTPELRAVPAVRDDMEMFSGVVLT